MLQQEEENGGRWRRAESLNIRTKTGRRIKFCKRETKKREEVLIWNRIFVISTLELSVKSWYPI